MTNEFEIPQEYIDQINSTLSDGEIELPFFAPVLWWNNGAPMHKGQGGVQYYGGWAMSAEDMDAAPQGILPGCKAETWTNRQGNEYSVYATRMIGFAPVAKRRRWIVNDNGHGRSHVQILGMLATLPGKDQAYVPWGPVVLSGKGYAGTRIEDALKDFDSGIREARLQHAPAVPPYFFFAFIGTHGKDPTVEQVGKTNKSPITPCKALLPATVSKEHLLAWFVGPALAPQMAEMAEQAQDWLDAWKEDNGNSKKAQPDNSYQDDELEAAWRTGETPPDEPPW